MQFLIHLPIQSTLAEAIQNLSDARLYAIFGPVILQRSHDYIDQIEDVDYAPGVAQTLIYGSDEYEVEIKHEASTARLYGDCSCPYDGGACKHLAAFLQYLREAEDLDEINHVGNALIDITPSEPVSSVSFDFKAWVKARSQEELENLVLQHAPESLRKSLALQAGSVNVQEELFQKAEKKVKKILKEFDEYDIDAYEEKLLKHLETLRPLWSLMPVKIYKLLRKVVEAIDKAQSEGYLYDDYNDGVFDGIELGAYIAEFVSTLPEPLFAEGFSEMLEVFGNLEYTICDNFLSTLLPKLDDSKGVILKNLFIAGDDLLSQQRHDQQKEIWVFLKPLLNTNEQKRLLKKLPDPFFILELADLYEQEGQNQEAIKLLTQRLSQPVKNHWDDSYNIAHGAEPLYEKLLGLLHKEKQDQDLKKWVYRYVEERASARSLSFSLQFLPEAQTELEALLKKRQVRSFAQYLEESFRTPEVVQLFKSHSKDFPQAVQYDFFKRNLLLFPKEAQVVFKQVLDQELPIAKEYSYQRVVEVLILLRELMEKQAFVALVQAIRAGYKRRPNLMALMQRAGLHFPEK
ncbi:SWIM zinc finger domain-containing protein [Haliscomenobacter sp.]|uniref:SWIM zinc finger family protein n=1 Tax=Haliscomenobacter sp. TaxID=2717303 RepID=UPI003592F525